MLEATEVDTSALQRLIELRQQAERLRSYVSRTEQARGQVRDAVLRKVLGEYRERLAAAEEQAGAAEAEAREAYATLLARRHELTAPCDEARLAIDELDLRYLVGEIDETTRDAQRQAPGEVVERLGAEIATLEPVIARFEEVLQLAPPTPARPAPAVAARPPAEATLPPAARPPAAPPPTPPDAATLRPDDVSTRPPAPAAAARPPVEATLPPAARPGVVPPPAPPDAATLRPDNAFTRPPAPASVPAVDAPALEMTREAPALGVGMPPVAGRPEAVTPVVSVSGAMSSVSGVRPAASPTPPPTKVFSPDMMATSIASDPLLLGVGTEPPTVVEGAPRAATKQPRVPVGYLTLTAGPGAGEYRLEKKTTIGRGDECTIRISDPTVSRHHAVVSASPDGFRIRDLQSQNGTLVNGEPVTDRPLADHDQILVGDVLLVFRRASAGTR